MPTIPDYFNLGLLNIAGRNIFGEPNLRVVWGEDARKFNGHIKYIDPITGRPMTCWVLERWMPPGFFGGKEAWEKDRWFYDDVHQQWVDLKGEYPTRGMHVMIHPLTRNGSYIPLDHAMLNIIKGLIRSDEEFASKSHWERDRLIRQSWDAEDAQTKIETQKAQNDLREYHLRNWDQINRSARKGYSITPR